MDLMDDLEAVARHLAERVAPDEVELAPYVTRLAAERGAAVLAPQEPQDAAVLGGIGIFAEVGNYAIVLKSLMAWAPLILSVLELTGQKELFFRQCRRLVGGETVEAADPVLGERVGRAVEALTRDLEGHGLATAKARSLSRETLLALLDMPERSRGVLRRFAQAK